MWCIINVLIMVALGLAGAIVQPTERLYYLSVWVRRMHISGPNHAVARPGGTQDAHLRPKSCGSETGRYAGCMKSATNVLQVASIRYDHGRRQAKLQKA